MAAIHAERAKAGKRRLYFRQHLAEGRHGDESFEIGLTMDGSTLVFIFDDATYLITVEALARDICDLRETEAGC